MDTKPIFRPEALHDLSEEDRENATSSKAQWKPDREKIEAMLKEHDVLLQLPKVYYSLQNKELQQILPQEASFQDDLIEKYEVFAVDDTTVQIRIYPKEADPFWVTIDRDGIHGSQELLNLYVVVQNQTTNSVQQYAHGAIHDVMGSREAALPLYGVSFHVTEGSDSSLAA